MKISRPLLALVLMAAVPMAASAAGQAQDKKGTAPLTVGEFAVMLAKTTGTGRALEGKSATDALVKAGVPLGNPKATLNEEKLAEVLGFYGVKVTTSSPDQAVNRAKAGSALMLLGGSMTSAASTVGPTPSTLEDCLVNANHGECTNCCKDLGGESNTCAKFCQQIMKGSVGEPLP
ncbi:MAG TPA: hypothetical protein VGV60_12720 [Candidatus Polarisedimenticolia bacterium]|jgi:hypothetical protein|nr:hypothetical protein [Candidatus Polarisedimenticolia bacterium]